MNIIKIHPFWYICIAIRLIISVSPLVYKHYFKKSDKYAFIFQFLLLSIGIGFGTKAIFGSNNETQFAKVFWHKTRFVHSFLFIFAAIHFHDYNLSSSLLFVSVLFSLYYRFISGHFKIL